MKKNILIALLTTKVLWDTQLIEYKTKFPAIAFLLLAIIFFVVIEAVEETIKENRKNEKDRVNMANTIRKHSDSGTSAS